MIDAGWTAPEVVLEHQSARVLQLRTPELGDSTYLVISGEETAVIDAQRDVERCEAIAGSLGGRIVAVLETHVHNDYLSGGPELARRHSATYLVPRDSGFVGAQTLFEGDEVRVGSCRLRPLFTPGHTAHHLSYSVVFEDQVLAVLSGGSVLVGSVGRSDLISPDQTEGLTRQQYRSAARIGELSDPVLLGPTHGAGSFCTSSPALDETWTTVGKERERNPAFLIQEEDDFVRQQLAGLGPYPAYYAHMAGTNRSGSRPWPAAAPGELAPAELTGLDREGVLIVDVRPRAQFAQDHPARAINIEIDGPFSAYLGWLFPLETRFALLGSNRQAQEAAAQAARIGADGVIGWAEAARWKESGVPSASHRSIDMAELRSELRAPIASRVIDVRQDQEWWDGHIPGSIHVPIQDLPSRVLDLASWPGTTFVHCASGYRAAIATSLLTAAGADAVHVDGGMREWAQAGGEIAN